ncbi:MAG: tetratricopeptide repeat protein [Bacteroidetes bacterium]|nr:tetratricopeptide repeat protein [Bacteroidota bacterium]
MPSALRDLGQWERAVANYDRVIAIDPQFSEAYTNRQIVYRKLQKAQKR